MHGDKTAFVIFLAVMAAAAVLVLLHCKKGSTWGKAIKTMLKTMSDSFGVCRFAPDFGVWDFC